MAPEKNAPGCRAGVQGTLTKGFYRTNWGQGHGGHVRRALPNIDIVHMLTAARAAGSDEKDFCLIISGLIATLVGESLVPRS